MQFAFVRGVNDALRDGLTRARAEVVHEQRIAVVDIDEGSIAALGPWPWPRARLADLVEMLLQQGARAVALDLILPERSDGDGDERLAALAQHAPLALATAFDFHARFPALRQGDPGPGMAPLPEAPMMTATGYLGNHPGLAGARCVGNIGFVPDTDGLLRHLPLGVRFGEQVFPSLAFALAACAARLPGVSAVLAQRKTDDSGSWRVPFRYSFSSYRAIPAIAVLSEDLPSDVLAGRLVLVGSSALGLADRVATPLAPSTSGVLVHAVDLSDLLDAAEGKQPAPWQPSVLIGAWLLISLAVLWGVLPLVSPWVVLATVVGLATTWPVLAWLALPHAPGLAPGIPLVFYFAVMVFGVPFEWWRSRLETGRIKALFSHYVAPAVLEEILRQRDIQPLSPKLCEVTVLIADMEGYTAHTAALPLDEAAKLTVDFLECLTQPVLETGGTLDKYTGDGVVAFWGAPIPSACHATQALTACREILCAVAAFNERRITNGLPGVRVRIGIESGQVLAGDLGTSLRSTYTAVGDCINLAAKLEQAARHLPVDAVIGPGTAALLNGKGVIPLGRLAIGNGPLVLDCWTPVLPASGPDEVG